MKLLRTIRLDVSDTFVFEPAAEPGEWAVSGAFVFWNRDAASFQGKTRTHFAAASSECRRSDGRRWYRSWKQTRKIGALVVETLARQLMTHFGAPTIDDATAAAEEEADFH